MTAQTPENPLPSWNDGAVRRSILDFVEAARDVPVEQRVAVFDNDGTLWCEKPSYAQLAFMLGQMRTAIAADPSLHERPEFAALVDGDKAAQAELGLPAIARALVELCADITADEFDRRVRSFVDTWRHPTLGVPLRGLRYQPMLELLDLLRAHDFSTGIVTGGGTEFVRSISLDFYGIEQEQVVGTMIGYRIERDANDRPYPVRTKDVFGAVDEGDAKVSNLQMGLGRRPIFAAGNSPGDSSMLEYARTSDGPSLALLVDHDDGDREFAYEGEAATFDSAGSFRDAARDLGWVVASMRDDWQQIFAPA